METLKVINLDRTPQRYADFLRWNPTFGIERISAVDGALLNRADCIRDGLITAENHYTSGALGNAMSHIALWKDCAAGSVPFHICEDDIVLRADFLETANALLEQLTEWDMVLWTHNFDWPIQVSPAPMLGTVVLQYQPDQVTSDFNSFRVWDDTPKLLRLVSAAGCGCYSIAPKGAANMLADCLPIGGTPSVYVANPQYRWSNGAIDVELSRHYGQRQVYVAVPPLALAPNDQANSTIRGHLAAMHDPSMGNRAP